MPKLIDTHCHLNFNAYKDDVNEVIKQTLAKDVWMINVGSQTETSKRAVEIAECFDKGVYATVGLHPSHLCETYIDEEEIEKIHVETRVEEFDYNFYKKLAKNEKVVAIGECGLDYTYLPKDCDRKTEINRQKQVFRAHLDLARELNLPVIIHCRDEHKDIFKILDEEKEQTRGACPLNPWRRGVAHCFTGDWKSAKGYLDRGCLISFTGIITFNVKEKLKEKQEKLIEVVKKTPLEKIMIETDAPYLAPEPHRGKRNEPLYVRYVAEKIAGIKGLEFDEVVKQTTKNAMEFFNLR